MFFRETKETEEDIRRMFHQVREKMKYRITLKKKSNPGKFAVLCLIGGFDYPSALCDTGSSVSILPKVMPDHLGTQEDSSESLRRAFMATVGAVCDMHNNKLCLTLINPTVYYDPVRVAKKQTGYMEIGDNPGFIAAFHCNHEADEESEIEASFSTQLEISIDEKLVARIDNELETPIKSDHANE
ncbi:hypothetical protein F2Q70_00005549 [Brassica cretica]|nr:hypothetical protein F2Q70_00005549 [Brassica cretica]KAF3562149.1 hypothetical protein DY000_02012636 [Brassica cretica]